MAAKTAAEIRGTEYDWLGSDGESHVALFCTAGGGYAPDAFLQDTDAHDAAIAAILALPASTRALSAPELGPDYVNTWKLVAERGLFAFDADVSGGPYYRSAVPETPVRLDQLPAAVRDVLRGLEFRHLSFSALSIIRDELLQDHDDQRRR